MVTLKGLRGGGGRRSRWETETGPDPTQWEREGWEKSCLGRREDLVLTEREKEEEGLEEEGGR